MKYLPLLEMNYIENYPQLGYCTLDHPPTLSGSSQLIYHFSPSLYLLTIHPPLPYCTLAYPLLTLLGRLNYFAFLSISLPSNNTPYPPLLFFGTPPIPLLGRLNSFVSISLPSNNTPSPHLLYFGSPPYPFWVAVTHFFLSHYLLIIHPPLHMSAMPP